MATKTTKQGFLSGNQSPEKIQRDFIQKPLDSARQSVLGSGLDLLSLLSVLPDAFIGSQRRELERVKASAGDNDDRVKVLSASIEQATILRNMAQRGGARIQRAIGSIANSEEAFHGFVSDAELQPFSGLTVRVSGLAGARGKKLTATTDKDGYFRIPLGSKTGTGKEWKTKVAEMNFAERIDSMFEQPTDAASAATDATSSSTNALAQVEILEKNEIIYTDPAGIPVDKGSVYREYVVSSDKTRSTSATEDSHVEAKTVIERPDVVKETTKKRGRKK